MHDSLRSTLAGVLLAFLVPAGALAQQRCPEQRLSSPNGPGVVVNQYCVRQEGEFRDGLLHGKGRHSYPTDRVEEGDFRRGRLWGRGRIAYADGRVAEGEFVDGRLSGLGRISWPDGRSHEGYFRNGSPEGPGRQVNAQRQIDEGLFGTSGKLDGKGIRTLADGGKLYGQFRDGNPVGDVTLVRPDGSEERQRYRMNGTRETSPPAPAATTSPAPAPVSAGSSPGAAQGQPAPQPAQGPAETNTGQVIQEVDRAIRGLRGIFGR